MRGLVLNLLEEVVQRERGADFWDDIVDEAAVSGAYTALGTYPDSDLLDLASAVARRVGTDTSAVFRHIGLQGFDILARRYPELVETHVDVRSFLSTLNQVTHPIARRLEPGVVVGDFEFETSEPSLGVLELVYRSERGWCDLAEGLILGAARHFLQQVDVEQIACVHRGNDVCVIRVTTR